MSNGSHCVAVNGKINSIKESLISHPVDGGANGFATVTEIITANIARAAHCEHIVAIRREERSSQSCTLSPRYHQPRGHGGYHSPDPGIASLGLGHGYLRNIPGWWVGYRR